MPLCKTVVKPNLECCVLLWLPYLKNCIAELEKVQKISAKLNQGLENLLWSILPTLEVFICFKKKGGDDRGLENYVLYCMEKAGKSPPPHNTGTWGHSVKLINRRIRKVLLLRPHN